MSMEEKDALTEKIIACCFKVHSALGAGFPEKIYQNALILSLKAHGLKNEAEKEFNVFFNDKKVGSLKSDLIIDNKVIVEVKAVTGIMPVVFKQQLISYLKISGLHVGLLVNFGNESCQVKRYMF